MRRENRRLRGRLRKVEAIVAGLGISCGAAGAQVRPPMASGSRSAQTAALSIERPAFLEMPFSVVGPRGAILGRQDGSYELWLFPWKILSGMKMSVRMQDYPVPIDVNAQAAEIEVEPDHTTVVYSHANFTIRQTMLAPKASRRGRGRWWFTRCRRSGR